MKSYNLLGRLHYKLRSVYKMGYKRKTVEFKNDNNCNKVVAYYRYSSSKQTEQSIERQIQIVEDFCAYKGLEIVLSLLYLVCTVSKINPKRR